MTSQHCWGSLPGKMGMFKLLGKILFFFAVIITAWFLIILISIEPEWSLLVGFFIAGIIGIFILHMADTEADKWKS